jgi:hypothetical protein
MTFLNFLKFSESVFPLKMKGKHFPRNQVKFFFNQKVFFVDQFF